MKRLSLQHYPKRAMIEDSIIVLMPPILMLIGVLWFFSKEWFPNWVGQALMPFVDSFLALLTSAA